MKVKLSIYQTVLLIIFLMSSCEFENEKFIEEQVQKKELEFNLKQATLLANRISKINVKNNPSQRGNPPAIQSSKTLTDGNNKNAVYVFNYENNNGFTIISGDKRLPPVLGQTDEGSFDFEQYKNIPGLNQWVNSIIEEIETKRSSNLNPSVDKIKKLGWEDEIKNFNIEPCDPCGGGGVGGGGNNESHGPLINTLWGQGCGFNDFTPEKPRGSCDHAPAGCGPVAVAQVMKHHRNELPALSYNGVPINFNDTSMPNWIPRTTGTAPNIARLMSLIGTGIIIDYANNYAMALPSLIPVFFETIGFNSELRGLDHTVVKNNIRNGNPVIFKARTRGAFGISFNHHIWVCDGYRSNLFGQYHMNWGWRGAGDAWYYISDWNPNNNDSNYTSGRKIITVSP